MITPREIMKGCIVNFEGKPHLVKGVTEFILLEGVKAWIGGSMMDGEPLSEDWLVRIGFEKAEDGDFYRQLTMLNWAISVRKNSLTGDWGAYQGFFSQRQELRITPFVHQLQVLFFAMTGEHLKTPKLK